MHCLSLRFCFASAVLSAVASTAVFAQQQPRVFDRIVGHINEPKPIPPTPGLVARLDVYPGFAIAPFAEGLEAPRMLAVAENGDVYVTRRAPHHDVLLLRDADGDGRAEHIRPVAHLQHVHGIALRHGRAYLAAVRELYVAEIAADGSLGEPEVLYSDLPDAGQHPNRTLKFSPDGRLFLSIGSTNNAAPEPNPENATLVIAATDGSGREVFARGLRNTIGFDWHPGTRELWGMDHGIDWLGDHEQREELNLLVAGGDYGWPFIYDDQEFNLHQNPVETTGLTWEEYAARTAPPVLGLSAHSAPMDLLFYPEWATPAKYRHDRYAFAFLALHGSWNRAAPIGYKVVVIPFVNGEPQPPLDFVDGFLAQQRRAQFGRPCGLAVARDGALLFSDDSGGVIYRVAARRGAGHAAETLRARWSR